MFWIGLSRFARGHRRWAFLGEEWSGLSFLAERFSRNAAGAFVGINELWGILNLGCPSPCPLPIASTNI